MNGRRMTRIARLSLSTLSRGKQEAMCVLTEQRQQHKKEKGFGQSWFAAGAGVSLALAGIKLQAEEEKKQTTKTSKVFFDTKAEGEVVDITKEDKIREYSPIDTLFDYFSSYQIIDNKGKKTTLMSVRNFYNAMTPGSSLSQGFGKRRSSYMTIEEEDLGAEWLISQNELPREGSLLNRLNKKGLLTYTDYHFLFLLMSTPRRYSDMVFHAFDVSADGNIEAKEFAYILAKIANVKTDPEELMKAESSGLIKYLFGDDLKGEINRNDFGKLQTELIDDVLSLEYTRYSPIEGKMSEVDFCRHMLYSSNITNKKKERMIQRISKTYGKEKGKGISFESFKTFYTVLFGGADLERAMFFLDTEGRGVNRAEFSKISQWVCTQDLDPHVIDVIYTLLDEDEDDNLSTREFNPVLFQWRHSRGFHKGSLAMTVGSLKF
eukprot:GFUD01110835.1.p1 GENE.GFUD01110835.1~~GFUD01110835.1.p1  ORF type:complete len:434 (+),score=104.54 GFUD01110835.1:31-1332(+)